MSVCSNDSFFACHNIRNSTNFMWIWQFDYRLKRREKFTATSTGLFVRDPSTREFIAYFCFAHHSWMVGPYIEACAPVHTFDLFLSNCSSPHSWIVWILEMKREISSELFYFQCIGNNRQQNSPQKIETEANFGRKKSCISQSGKLMSEHEYKEQKWSSNSNNNNSQARFNIILPLSFVVA